jgi:hypothetical protein
MTTLRIRGIYAVALTQLFRQYPDTWEIVQPDEEVRSCIAHAWRMDSPEVDIDDAPEEHGHRETIRLAGSADAVQKALTVLQQHCFDVITHHDSLQVGAIYMGLVGICSRVRRRAIVYLGNQLVGVLPLRYEDRDLRVGSYLPVRIAALPAEGDDRPQLSNSITLPGDYAVLTSAQVVRLSKQITDPQQQERLRRLGEQGKTDDWGIIWRTAAQHTEDQVLVAELDRLLQEAHALRERLQATSGVGYVHGGEMVARVYLPGNAKALCDTLRAQLLPTLPGHHKYKARGDVYATTVDALEKELPADVLRTRTMHLGVLSSLDAMQQQPIEDRLHLLMRDLDGTLREQDTVQRIEHDLHAGWVEVRRPLRHRDAYPPDLRLNKQPGDYTTIRFQEGQWSYTAHVYGRNGDWKAIYACLTTPLTIFADQIHVLDLHVTVMRSTKQQPEIRGLQALQQEQEKGSVTEELVRKVREEAERLRQQFLQEETQAPDQG